MCSLEQVAREARPPMLGHDEQAPEIPFARYRHARLAERTRLCERNVPDHLAIALGDERPDPGRGLEAVAYLVLVRWRIDRAPVRASEVTVCQGGLEGEARDGGNV